MSEQSVESLYSDIRKYFHDSLCNGLLWGKYAVCEGERVSQKLLNEIDETAKELKEIIFENGHTFKDVHEFHRTFAELLRIFMDETSKRAKSVKADTNKFSKLVSNFQMMDQMKLSMYQGECVLYGMELITGWADYVFYCQCPNFSRLDYYGIALKAKIMEISLNVNETLGTGETPETNDEYENGEYEDAPLEGRFWLNIKERKDKIVSILSQIQHEGLENYFSFYTEAWDRLLSWDEAARGFKYECVKHPVINQIIRVGAFGQRRDLCNYLIRYYELSLANEEDLYDVDLEEDPYEKRNL